MVNSGISKSLLVILYFSNLLEEMDTCNVIGQIDILTNDNFIQLYVRRFNLRTGRNSILSFNVTLLHTSKMSRLHSLSMFHVTPLSQVIKVVCCKLSKLFLWPKFHSLKYK